MQNGTVEVCHTATYYFIGKDPTWALFCAVPFGLNTRQQNAWFYDGDGQKLMNEFGKKFNVYSAASAATPARRWAAGSARRSRPSTISKASSSASAAGPARPWRSSASCRSRLAGGDIYPALEKGTIDAAEWVGPYDDEKLGFYKIAPYYYYPGWWEGGTANHFLINHGEMERAAEELSGDRHGGRGCLPMWSKPGDTTRAIRGALKRLVAGGAQLRAFSQPIMEACLKASNEVNAETSADEPRLQEGLGLNRVVPQRRVSVVAGRRIQLRQFHDPHAGKDVKMLVILVERALCPFGPTRLTAPTWSGRQLLILTPFAEP